VMHVRCSTRTASEKYRGWTGKPSKFKNQGFSLFSQDSARSGDSERE
jgi:hypothetical protein